MLIMIEKEFQLDALISDFLDEISRMIFSFRKTLL